MARAAPLPQFGEGAGRLADNLEQRALPRFGLAVHQVQDDPRRSPAIPVCGSEVKSPTKLECQ